jgi:hypothetical protein
VCACVPFGLPAARPAVGPLYVHRSCPLTDIVTTKADWCQLLPIASSSCQTISDSSWLWNVYESTLSHGL